MKWVRKAIDPKVGDRVRILKPAYVAGKVGVICDREVLSGAQSSDHWLIRVDSTDILLSLPPQEFKIITNDT